MQINAHYVAEPPLVETAVRLFEGEWVSKIPGFEAISGNVPLFEDHRIRWWIDQHGSFDGQSVLELGPLEAGHTRMLHDAGAEIFAIEANTAAFLKCLVVKECLRLSNTEFRLGNFDYFLAATKKSFGAVLACGVLYHLSDPLVTLSNIARITNEIYIWSHFFNDAAMPANDPRRHLFTGDTSKREYDGFIADYHYQIYAEDKPRGGFVGGIWTGSVWMERDQVVSFLKSKGFDVTIIHEHNEHPHGPASGLHAVRSNVI